MKQSLIRLLAFILIIGSANAQDKKTVGYSVGGTIVSIDGKNPIGLKFDHDGFEFHISRITPTDVEVRIKNNTDSMALLSLDDSYFVSGGETESVITDETILLDVDKPMQDIKIAPKTSTSKRLMSKEQTVLALPFFSNRWANDHYKKSGESTNKSLVVVIKSGGLEVQHSFDFKVQGSDEIKAIKNK